MEKKYTFERQIKYISNSDWHHMLRVKSIKKALQPLHKFNFFFHSREFPINFIEQFSAIEHLNLKKKKKRQKILLVEYRARR